jgi:hypothetical protein
VRWRLLFAQGSRVRRVGLDALVDSVVPGMLFMVIETYKHGAQSVYARAAERGRMLPLGLAYLDSWVDERRLDRCFQLMETENSALFDDRFDEDPFQPRASDLLRPRALARAEDREPPAR